MNAELKHDDALLASGWRLLVGFMTVALPLLLQRAVADMCWLQQCSCHFYACCCYTALFDASRWLLQPCCSFFHAVCCDTAAVAFRAVYCNISAVLFMKSAATLLLLHLRLPDHLLHQLSIAAGQANQHTRHMQHLHRLPATALLRPSV
jgi:hypothetical protein